MKITKSFDKSTFRDNKKILIYGAGRYGKLAYYGLLSMGITPYAFIDNYYSQTEYMSLNVLNSSRLCEFTNDIILIASYNYFYEMYSDAQAKGCENIYDIMNLILAKYDDNVLDEYTRDEKNNADKYRRVIENVDLDKLIITHVELVVTECCTLKCKDCANLIQYYKKPCNIDVMEICKSFDRFLDAIDILLELRILGGEPFIVKNLDYIINRYVVNEKVKNITIYTNSTVVPNEKVMEALNNNKITVHMSDYGAASSKIKVIEEAFKRNAINYIVHKYVDWFDLGEPKCHNYDLNQLLKMYNVCIMSKCYTFYRDKFYVCPRAAHGEQLGFYTNGPEETVDFTDRNLAENKRGKLYKVINDLKYISACDFCNGSSKETPLVPAARQVNIS